MHLVVAPVLSSFWTDLARALAFHAGWWSVGTWLALVAAFATSAVMMIKARTDLIVGAVLVSGPIATVVVFGLLKQFADQDPGCTYDCEGRLLLFGPAGGTLIGWGIGLMGGALWRSAKRDPR